MAGHPSHPIEEDDCYCRGQQLQGIVRYPPRIDERTRFVRQRPTGDRAKRASAPTSTQNADALDENLGQPEVQNQGN